MRSHHPVFYLPKPTKFLNNYLIEYMIDYSMVICVLTQSLWFIFFYLLYRQKNQFKLYLNLIIEIYCTIKAILRCRQ